MESLNNAAPHIDRATLSVRGAFYHQRGRINKEMGMLDAAFTDYAGAEVYWREIGATEKVGAVALNLAGLCLHRGELETAHEYVARAIEVFAQSESFYITQAYDTEAQIFLAEGKIDAALRSIERALILVGDNDAWRQEFEATKKKIINTLVSLVAASGLKLSTLQRELMRLALIKHGGNITRAARDIGMSRKGASDLIDRAQELEPYRVERRVRYERIIK
jgi:tetratricopeptide (TPR) repeat protein